LFITKYGSTTISIITFIFQRKHKNIVFIIMSVPYKNPISSVQVSTPQSVDRTSVFGTNFSVLNVGGYMEVYNLSDLSLTLTASTYPSLIQLSANTIPIRYTRGNGTFLSPDYLTLNSDNISSGRRRLGMLVYVHETDLVYQYVIPNYDTLWNNLSGLTGFSSVTYSDYTTVINDRSSAGQSFLSGWTSSNIEGVSGFTSTNSNWRVYLPGGSTSGLYLPLSGGTVFGPTVFTSGLTATTISATTYQNLPITVVNNSNLFSTGLVGSGVNASGVTDSIFFGSNSGSGATNANYSNFFGQNAGRSSINASGSNFMGRFAGYNVNSGLYPNTYFSSNFFGPSAGNGATNAYQSNFFGYLAGGSSSGSSNSNFFGYQSGLDATNTNNSNFFGENVGQSATNANNSNFIGQNTGYFATGASYSNFFGFQTGYQATNANNSNFFGNYAGIYATGAYSSNFIGPGSGYGSLNAYQSNFIGSSAGYSATSANDSNFFGRFAGYQATGATYSNFFGNGAGYGATNAYDSTFIGQSAGGGATGATNSIFIGFETGYNAKNASYSNFFGNEAGGTATNANNSNFFGADAGFEATNASRSNFFGTNVGNYATNASYSNLFGFNVGNADILGSIGSNNIIIGTNISLSAGTTNSINLGGVLFGTNTYSTTTGIPSISAQTTGKIGINVVKPLESLHVYGNTLINGGLTANTISATTYLNLPTTYHMTQTYSEMVGLTGITNLTMVKVLNDENKGITNAIYHIYPDGVRMWIAATKDN
jgi:hypothetical protein